MLTVDSVIQRESDEHISNYGQVTTGSVAVTSAGNIEGVNYVIHAVGPIAGSGHWNVSLTP